MPKKKKTKLFYSGSSSGRSLPEIALIDDKPDLMLTYYEIREKKGNTQTRFNRHVIGRMANETKTK